MNNQGISLVRSIDISDYEESANDDITRNILNRFQGTGIIITDIKIKMPGDN